MNDQTFTLSALVDLLSNSFASYKTEKSNTPGNYYYSQIKTAKIQNKSILVKLDSLDIIEDKVDTLTITQKKRLISRALIDFANRNIPDDDAKMFCKNMRWTIVK